MSHAIYPATLITITISAHNRLDDSHYLFQLHHELLEQYKYTRYIVVVLTRIFEHHNHVYSGCGTLLHTKCH